MRMHQFQQQQSHLPQFLTLPLQMHPFQNQHQESLMEGWMYNQARVTARLRRRADLVQSLKQRADSICLTADGVPSGPRVPLLPGGAAWPGRYGLHAQRYCSGNRWLAQEERRHGSCSRGQRWAHAGQQCGGLWTTVIHSARALALEGCPAEEDLSILTDSLSSMRLLRSMQRSDLPLSL